MAWEVEFTDQFNEWWGTLTENEEETVIGAVFRLRERGPALGRPLVDRVHTSRHHNMKELRPGGSSIRVLFAFDPRRVAILLIGGDKTDRWQTWYEQTIPVADHLYDEHLETLHREGA